MIFTYVLIPGHVAQSETTDACLTADQGGSEFDPGWSDTFVKIEHEINQFLRSFSTIPLIHSRRVAVRKRQKYVHEVLVTACSSFVM